MWIRWNCGLKKNVRNKLPIITDPVEYLHTLKDAYDSWPVCGRDHREPVKLKREIERVKGEIDAEGGVMRSEY